MLLGMEAIPTEISICEMIGNNDRQAAEITQSEEGGVFHTEPDVGMADVDLPVCSTCLAMASAVLLQVGVGATFPFHFFFRRLDMFVSCLVIPTFCFAISNCFGRLR